MKVLNQFIANDKLHYVVVTKVQVSMTDFDYFVSVGDADENQGIIEEHKALSANHAVEMAKSILKYLNKGI